MNKLTLRMRSVVGLVLGTVLGLLSGTGLGPGEVDRTLNRRLYVRSIRSAASPKARRLFERADTDPFAGYFGVRCAIEVDASGRGWILIARHQRLSGDSVNGSEWMLSAPGLEGLRVIVL